MKKEDNKTLLTFKFRRWGLKPPITVLFINDEDGPFPNLKNDDKNR